MIQRLSLIEHRLQLPHLGLSYLLIFRSLEFVLGEKSSCLNWCLLSLSFALCYSMLSSYLSKMTSNVQARLFLIAVTSAASLYSLYCISCPSTVFASTTSPTPSKCPLNDYNFLSIVISWLVLPLPFSTLATSKTSVHNSQ